MILRFAFSISLIIVGMTAGYAIRRASAAGRFGLPSDLKPIRVRLQRIALLALNPIAFIGAMWVAPLNNVRVIALPFVGLFALTLGGALAALTAKAFGLTRPQRGTYIVSGGFTNIGSVGALLVFVLLGEPAFAFVPVYKLFEEILYYAVGFPLARAHSPKSQPGETLAARIASVLKDPFVVVTLLSITTGLVLNFSGARRPDWYATVNAIVVPVVSFLLLLSIGMGLRFDLSRRYLKYSAGIVAIKHALVPLCVTTLAWLVGLGTLAGGLPLQVVLILSSMPVGFIAMVPPTLYELDVDLANSNWIASNLVLLLMIPVLGSLVTLL